jgi:hypothetical protein
MSLFVFVSSALDVLLSGEQKRDLADKTTAALFVLAEVKSAERTIKILRNNRVQRWTSSFFAVPTILIGPWAAVQINFMGAQFVIFWYGITFDWPKANSVRGDPWQIDGDHCEGLLVSMCYSCKSVRVHSIFFLDA